MLFAVDAGNTNVTFAVFDGTVRKSMWRIKTDASRTADEYISFLFPLFEIALLKPQNIKHVLISSVVPDANFSLRMLSHQAFQLRPDFIGKDITDFGIQIKTDKPEELGADRLVNTIAVIQYYKPPAIVVDFGTATTFDVIDKDGAFAGGVIAPGVNLSLNALHMAAAKLPKVSISKPSKVIATNTVTAMQSGVYWGYVELVTGMISRIQEELGEKVQVIATGGLAPLFEESIDLIDYVDEDLTLKGLLTIHHRYKSL
jgi:type III pantothenate kinase